VSAGWLDADGISGHQGAGDGIGGWGDGAENGVVHWVVVQSSGQLADGAGGLESGQAGVDGRGTQRPGVAGAFEHVPEVVEQGHLAVQIDPGARHFIPSLGEPHFPLVDPPAQMVGKFVVVAFDVHGGGYLSSIFNQSFAGIDFR
jgi:hypothetical protein